MILKPGGLQRAQRRLAPLPGPFTYTATVAHAVLHRLLRGVLGGELRRERRRLARALEPARRRSTTRPRCRCTSVMVTIVLLNVDWMCTIPLWTFFLTFLRFGALLRLRPLLV